MIKIALLSFLSLASAGLVPQHGGEDSSYDNGHHYAQATSYQHVKIENYHPIPVYIKKEHAQLLEHPVSKGHTATNVEIHHGGAHGGHHGGHEYQDPGYAVVSGTHQDYHQGLGAYAGQHEAVAEQEDGGHYEGGDYSGHDLQQYGGQQEVADYGHQPSGYEQEHDANAYEQEVGQHLQYHH